MDPFILVSALAAICWGTSNVIDKVLVSRYIDEPLVTAFIGGLGGVLALPVLVVFTDGLMVGAGSIAAGLVGGAIWVLAFVPYYEAMQRDSASNNTLFMQTIPLFVLMISVLTIGESVSLLQSAGILLFVIGGVIVQWGRGTGGIGLDRTAVLILSASFLFALGDVFLKVVADVAGAWVAYTWVLAGSFLASVVLYLFHGGVRSGFSEVLDDPMGARIDLLVFGRVLYLVGLFGLVYAVTLGPVSIASAVMNIRPLYVLVLVYAIGWMGWGAFEERFDHAALLPKVVATVLFIVAVYLVR